MCFRQRGLFLGFLVLGCTVTSANAADKYYPLDAGRKWTYQTASSGDLLAVAALPQRELFGRQATPFQVTSSEITTTEFYAEDQKGVQSIGYQDERHEAPEPWTPSGWVLRYPLRKGQSWQSSLTVESDGRPVKLRATAKVESVKATISVPAGRFTSCLRVRTVATQDAPFKVRVEQVEHYAPNVGLVSSVVTERRQGHAPVHRPQLTLHSYSTY